jgi:peptide/nickel transport system substrate-binding protein
MTRSRSMTRIMLATAVGLSLAALVTVRASAQTPKPQYGGTLEIGAVYVTLSALSWGPQDWNWKPNHDTGMDYEQLSRPISTRACARAASTRSMRTPSDTIRSELAER